MIIFIILLLLLFVIKLDLNYYDEAISAVNEMADNYKSESEIIKTRVIDIQKQNCYNFLKTIGIKRYGNK